MFSITRFLLEMLPRRWWSLPLLRISSLLGERPGGAVWQRVTLLSQGRRWRGGRRHQDGQAPGRQTPPVSAPVASLKTQRSRGCSRRGQQPGTLSGGSSEQPASAALSPAAAVVRRASLSYPPAETDIRFDPHEAGAGCHSFVLRVRCLAWGSA